MDTYQYSRFHEYVVVFAATLILRRRRRNAHSVRAPVSSGIDKYRNTTDVINYNNGNNNNNNNSSNNNNNKNININTVIRGPAEACLM